MLWCIQVGYMVTLGDGLLTDMLFYSLQARLPPYYLIPSIGNACYSSSIIPTDLSIYFKILPLNNFPVFSILYVKRCADHIWGLGE